MGGCLAGAGEPRKEPGEPLAADSGRRKVSGEPRKVRCESRKVPGEPFAGTRGTQKVPGESFAGAGKPGKMPGGPWAVHILLLAGHTARCAAILFGEPSTNPSTTAVGLSPAGFARLGDRWLHLRITVVR